MARRRKFSDEPFGPTIERLMTETGVTYRGLADKTKLSAGYLNHLVHGNRPVPSDKVVGQLAKALDVEPEHFREYRLRVITQKLEAMPDLIDRIADEETFYRLDADLFHLALHPEHRKRGLAILRERAAAQPPR